MVFDYPSMSLNYLCTFARKCLPKMCDALRVSDEKVRAKGILTQTNVEMGLVCVCSDMRVEE